MSEFLIGFGVALYAVWFLNWFLVFIFFGSSSLGTLESSGVKTCSLFKSILKLNAWAFLSLFWPTARAWSPTEAALVSESLKLRLGVIASSVTAMILGAALLFIKFDPAFEIFTYSMVIFSSMGALIHLMVAIPPERIKFWGFLYLTNWSVPIASGIIFYLL